MTSCTSSPVDTAKLREIALVVGDAGGYATALQQAADELDVRRKIDVYAEGARHERFRMYRAHLASAAFRDPPGPGRSVTEEAKLADWYRQQAEHVDRAARALLAVELAEPPNLHELLDRALAVASGEILHRHGNPIYGFESPGETAAQALDRLEAAARAACPACSILADVERALSLKPEPLKGPPA